MPASPSVFPPGFLWGSATAAYQIEGAARTDGRTPSVWDTFCTRAGKIEGAQSGDTACDHYHRWPGDVALMRDIGLQSYRLSLSWSRLLPDGTGRVNETGLAYYERLIDALLAAGIQPLVTLFHWDLPQALHDRGGWVNRDIAGWFADYADLVVRRLGDRVHRWCTHNEAGNVGALGHHLGIHAPGLDLAHRDYFRVVHHLNLSHGRATAVLRAGTRGRPARIGQAFNQNVNIPLTPDAAGLAAASDAAFSFDPANPWWSSHLWVDPLFTGDYSPAVRAHYGDAFTETVRDDDLRVLSAPMDYFGWNYYMDWSQPQQADGKPLTMMKWQMHPEGLYWGPKILSQRYGLPVDILENGLASMDWVTTEGTVPDHFRIDHMRRHLRELRRALADGVNIGAYYYWSFLDNFEWAHGYYPRFGLVHVDYQTQKRTLKASADFYREVIRTHGACL